MRQLLRTLLGTALIVLFISTGVPPRGPTAEASAQRATSSTNTVTTKAPVAPSATTSHAESAVQGPFDLPRYGTAQSELALVANGGANIIAADGSHTCALTNTGGVKCWGGNAFGQLGDGTTTARLTAVYVSGLSSGAMAIAAAGNHTCALTSNGAIMCWGSNSNGQLGDGTTTDRTSPVFVRGLTGGVLAIATGTSHTCALLSGGSLRCWGDNAKGQLGDGTATDRLIPVSVSGLGGIVVAVSAGAQHTCALLSNGGVKCWGWNTYAGQLGDGTSVDHWLPTQVSGLTSGVTTIASGPLHNCALLSGGGLKCWGFNYTGQLGDGSNLDRPAPVTVIGLSGAVTAIALGFEHTCALMTGGSVKCWGTNFAGQLGDGTNTGRPTPGLVRFLSSGVLAIGAGSDTTCAQAASGLRCWGNNDMGQIGDCSTINRLIPVGVVGLTANASCAKPVIMLVHGFYGLGSKTQSFCSGATRHPDHSDFPALADWLTAAGYEVWSAHLDTGYQHTASLRQNAACLRDQIAQVARGGKVILVAHSMGGLVARAYLEAQTPGFYRNDVQTLFTLGTPHQGEPFGVLVKINNIVHLFSSLTCKVQVAVCEFTTGIDAFNNDLYRTRRPGVDYYLVGGNLSFGDATWSGWLNRALIPGDNDGGVPQASALTLPNAHQTLATNEAHTPDLGRFSYFSPPPGDLYSLAYEECIYFVLVAGNRDGCQPLAAQLPTAADTMPAGASSLPMIQGTVASGQVVTHAVSLDGSEAVVGAGWLSGTLSLTLTSPSGVVVDPTFAAQHADQVAYSQAEVGAPELGATYVISAPEPGLWVVTLTGGTIPGGTAAYSLLTELASPITLKLQFDRDWYTVGQTAIITASLGQADAQSIQVIVQRSDSVTGTISLVSQGAGVWTGSYTVPAAPGYVTAIAEAVGVADGHPFLRETWAGFQIAPSTYGLSGSYSEVVQPWWPNSMLYQALTVTIGVQANVSGTVGLAADLTTDTGQPIAHSSSIQGVTLGSAAVKLRFEGADIYAGAHNGPYRLSNVHVLDMTDAALVTAEASDVFTTAAYDYRQFGTPVILLPLILR